MKRRRCRCCECWLRSGNTSEDRLCGPCWYEMMRVWGKRGGSKAKAVKQLALAKGVTARRARLTRDA